MFKIGDRVVVIKEPTVPGDTGFYTVGNTGTIQQITDCTYRRPRIQVEFDEHYLVNGRRLDAKLWWGGIIDFDHEKSPNDTE